MLSPSQRGTYEDFWIGKRFLLRISKYAPCDELGARLELEKSGIRDLRLPRMHQATKELLRPESGQLPENPIHHTLPGVSPDGSYKQFPFGDNACCIQPCYHITSSPPEVCKCNLAGLIS